MYLLNGNIFCINIESSNRFCPIKGHRHRIEAYLSQQKKHCFWGRWPRFLGGEGIRNVLICEIFVALFSEYVDGDVGKLDFSNQYSSPEQLEQVDVHEDRSSR